MVRVCITTSASSNNIKSYRVMVEHVDDGIHQHPIPTLVYSCIHAYTWVTNKQIYIYHSAYIMHHTIVKIRFKSIILTIIYFFILHFTLPQVIVESS